MAAANPFVYGEVVTSAAFADREQERDRLARDLGEGQKVFLISPRRYGKSSLIRGVMEVLAAYARALLSAETPSSGFHRWAAGLLAAVHPQLRFDPQPSGTTKISISF